MFAGWAAGGTQASPSAIQQGNLLAIFSGVGYGTTGFGTVPPPQANMIFQAEENFTDTAKGTAIGFNTTPLGTIGLSRRMTITANGFVGIGTTDPQGLLDVNGTIYQRGASLHADYVFESDYKLESIKEHADFMWKNKHLTAIPGLKVDQKGQEVVEVGSHRKGIVEELEKAHIYIEQLYKQNKKLVEQNKTLEVRLARIESRLSE